MSSPSRTSILHLYGSMLRASRSFTSYNFRQYFIRRTRSTFRQLQNESDAERIKAFYDNGLRELEVLRRSAIVNSLYGGRRLVVERSDAEEKIELERGDN
ncbi:hypothetical protein EXIGLDRAFT_765688 [Exidia glandulosa HHB12029]|uniref:Complex 1 LYR protein domain-containing protein n=1 Tax=Exidia glandulosa HHB12029 TaxID=1314781 RepID=A0A165K9D5_EXIGL|nr:hypothetical protein EXIGLDRAFT_765688 [Exidia glandulosa HHB12029]